jgi:hypothetical protein
MRFEVENAKEREEKQEKKGKGSKGKEREEGTFHGKVEIHFQGPHVLKIVDQCKLETRQRGSLASYQWTRHYGST